MFKSGMISDKNTKHLRPTSTHKTSENVDKSRNTFIKTEASLPVVLQMRWGISRITLKAFGHKI
jgi:hypothetical protein